MPEPVPKVTVKIPRLEKQQEQDAGEALLYGEMFNMDASAAYDGLDTIREEVPKIEAPVWRGWLDSWNMGVKEYEKAMLRSKQVLGDATEEDLKRIEALQGEIKGITIGPAKNIADRAVRLAAQMSPLMLKGLESGLKRGLAFGTTAASMAAILGQAGPQALVPEEIFTVPGAAIGGFQVGMTSGALENIMRAEAGYSYEELLNLDIDPEIARAAAGGVGIVNGLLELAQIKTIIDTIPGGRALFRKALSEGIRAALKKKGLKALALKYGKQYAGAVATNTLQEVAQESTNIVMGEVAKKVNNALKGTDLKPAEIKDIVNRLLETAEESALAFGVMALPGTTVKAGAAASKELGERGSIEAGGYKDLKEFEEAWEKKGVESHLYETEDTITLSKVVVPKEQRKEGIGTQYMNELTSYADATNKEIILTPSTDFGATSVTRLKKFYKQFGFVENKGRNKDFTISESMYRVPQGAERGSFEIGKSSAHKAKTFRAWVAAIGGINYTDEGWAGELKDLRKGAKWQPGLWNKKGYSMDEIVAQAQEHGWGQIQSGDDVLDALTNNPERATFDEAFEGMLDEEWNQYIEETEDEHPWEYTEGEIGQINQAFGEAIQAEIPGEISTKERLDQEKFINGKLRLYNKKRKPRPKQTSFIKTPRQREAALQKEKREILKEATVPGDKKTVKQRVRIVSGQYKIGELMIPESKALEAAFKKAEQAARIALREGKKMGLDIGKVKIETLKGKQKERVLKLKQDLADYKQKVKDRATKKRLRDYAKKLAKQITQPVPKSVDFQYAEAIRTLAQDIDPNFRMDKTLERRERTRQYLAQSPKSIEDIPRKLLAELAKKPLNDFTIADLENIAIERKRLTKLGKLKLEMKEAKRTHQFEKDLSEIVSNVLAGEVLEEDLTPVVSATGQDYKRRDFRKLVSQAFYLRPSRVFDVLDRGKLFEGKTHRVFYDRANRAENAKLKKQSERLDLGAAKLKELGIKVRELSDTMKINGIDYKIDEMIDVYVGMKNPRKSMAIEFGNNIDEKTAKKIISLLDDKYKKLGDFLIAEYEQNYNRLRKAFIEFANDDMGWEPNYTPMKRQDIDHKYLEQEIADEILHRNTLKRRYAEKGFTIQRKDIPEQYQKPIKLGAYETWLAHVPKQEQFIHFGQVVKDLHRIERAPAFRSAIRQQFNTDYVKAVEEYVNRLADPNIYKSFNTLENVSRTLRGNVALAYLAYNLLTMGKQLPSVALFLHEAGPINLIAAAGEFAAHPFKSIEWVKEIDPQMKNRSLEREMEELKNADKPAFLKLQTALGKAGMKGIYFFDRIAVTIGWMATYNRYVNKLGPDLAAEKAQKAVLRTQPAASAKDLAQLYTTNEFLNWFTQFTNQLNQIYNIATHDIPSLAKNAKYWDAFMGVTGLSIAALGIWMITNRRLPEDEEDLKEAISNQALSALPIVGKQIANRSQGWSGGGDISLFLPAEAVGVALSDAKTKTKINKVLEALAVMTGTPYIGIKRAIKAEPLGAKKKKKRKRGM